MQSFPDMAEFPDMVFEYTKSLREIGIVSTCMVNTSHSPIMKSSSSLQDTHRPEYIEVTIARHNCLETLPLYACPNI